MNIFEAQLTAIAIPAGRLTLRGWMQMPAEPPKGLVLFAHDGESSAHQPCNQRLVDALYDVGLGTLSCDLVPETVEMADGFHARLRHDIALLSERLQLVTRWARRQPELAELSFGYFGIGHGSSAALAAAATNSGGIQAVVTRGGRPEVADSSIQRIRTPTLLIVGGNDEAAAQNLETWARLRCEKSIEIIPGAGHRFEEPGALDNVAALAARWFSEHLGNAAHLAA